MSGRDDGFTAAEQQAMTLLRSAGYIRSEEAKAAEPTPMTAGKPAISEEHLTTAERQDLALLRAVGLVQDPDAASDGR